MPTPYDSGPFYTGVSGRSQGSTCLYDGRMTLWLVGGDDDGMLNASTVALIDATGKTIPIEEGALAKATWASSKLNFAQAENQPSPVDGWRPWCFSTSALAQPGEDLYLFWNQQSLPPDPQDGVFHDGTLVASFTLSSTTWCYPLTLLTSDGNRIVTSGAVAVGSDPPAQAWTCADVTATAFGPDTILVACAMALPGPGDPDWDSPQRGIYLGIYPGTSTLMDFVASTWQATWHTFITWQELLANNTPIDAPGFQISMDWFAAQPDATGNPRYMLTLLSNPAFPGAGPAAANYLQAQLVLDHTGMPATIKSAQIQVSTPPSVWKFEDVNDFYGSTQPFSVRRDPAGRLVASGTAPGDTIRFASFSATTDDSRGGYLQPATFESVPAPHADVRVPTVTYFTDPTPLPPTDSDVTELHAVYQIWFWSSDVRCEIRRYGTIEVLTNWQKSPFRSDFQPNVPQGIIEGSIPIPNENIAHASFSGETERGEIAYENLNASEQSTSLSSEQTSGYSIEEHFTKGIGPSYSTGFSSTSGNESGSTQISTLSQNKPLAAIVEKDPTTNLFHVRPNGALFCKTPVLHITVYRFRGPDGTLWSDPTSDGANVAPGGVLVTVDLTDIGNATTVAYTPFAVAPGNLYSYTPQAWNARMASLAERFPGDDPDLYAGSNYFRDVIVANAYTFPGNIKYLDASWTPGSGPQVKSEQSNETFTARSWTLESDFYAGLSGGAAFELFGMGEDVEFNALAGTTCVDSGNIDTTTINQWGIELADGWGPTTADDVATAFANYTFRIYFLPALCPPKPKAVPINTWTRELRQYLGRGAGDTLPVTLTQAEPAKPIPVTVIYPTPTDPAVEPPAVTIDPGVGSWRLVYVLESFQRNDGIRWTYDGSLD